MEEEDDLAVVADMVAADRMVEVVAVGSTEDTSSGSIADFVIFSNKEEAFAVVVADTKLATVIIAITWHQHYFNSGSLTTAHLLLLCSI